MAFVHGKNTAFKLDNSAGTLVDISAYLESVDLPESIETAETTTFGASAKSYIGGLADATISLSGKWDPTLDAHLAGLKGLSSTSTFEYGPAGSGSGAIKYSGEAILTSFEVNSSVGDVTTWSAELQVTGNVARGAFA